MAASLAAARRPVRARAASDADDAQRRTVGFCTAMLAATLLLQRFGLPLGGGKSFSVVGPLGLGIAGVAMLRGVLVFDRIRLAIYCAFAFCVMTGIAWHAMQPNTVLTTFAGPANLDSLAQFLLLTFFATLTFAEPLEEGRFFRTVNRWFAIVAIAGAIQFAAQFAGISIFAFTGLLPDSILFESLYHLQIPLGVGDLLKSNGFFLIEPSTFSQVMAIALIAEILAFRRPAYLALFVGGLLLSFSGTGWIVLGAFVLAAAIGMGGRGIAIAVATVVVLGLVVGALAWLAPDVAASLQGRFDEFSTPGTSGHRRFITPFWAMHDVLAVSPSTSLLGIGSGVSERLNLPYGYDVNTPVKVFLEYGLPALVAYLGLFLWARRTPVQAALVAPVLVMVLFTGAYQQFPPVLFLVLLLITVARLAPGGTRFASAAPRMAPRSAAPRSAAPAAR